MCIIFIAGDCYFTSNTTLNTICDKFQKMRLPYA